MASTAQPCQLPCVALFHTNVDVTTTATIGTSPSRLLVAPPPTLLQLMMYDDNRYEVESKYTQFITLTSRPIWPRLAMGPLAAVLNQLEARYSSSQQQQHQQQQQQVQQQQQSPGVWRTNSGCSTPGSAKAATAGQQQQQLQQQRGQGVARPAAAAAAGGGGLVWVANSLTDTGRSIPSPYHSNFRLAVSLCACVRLACVVVGMCVRVRARAV
jgi:hypothetical protein